MGNIINASVNQEGLAILAALEESALAETSAKTSKSQGGVMGFNYSESTYAPHVKSLPAAGTPSSPHKSTTGRSLPHTKKEIKRMIKNHSPGITPRTSISTFYSRRVGSETPVEASIRVGWGETMDVDDQDLQNLSMLPMGTPSFNLSPKKMSTPVKPPPHSTTYVAVPTPGAGAPLGTTFVATPAASANATFDACVKSCPGAAHNATFTKSSGSAGRRQASPRHDATFTKPSASAAAADAAVNVCVNSCPRVASSGRRPTAPITAVTKARPKSGKGGAFIRKKITKLLDQQSKQEVLLLSAKVKQYQIRRREQTLGKI